MCLFQASLFLSSLAVLSLRGQGKVASMKSVHCSCPYSITKHYPLEGKWTIMEGVERGMRCTNTDRDFFTLLFWNKMPLHAYGLQGYMLTFIVNGYVRSNYKAARHWSHYLTDLMEEPLQLSIGSTLLPPPPPPHTRNTMHPSIGGSYTNCLKSATTRTAHPPQPHKI